MITNQNPISHLISNVGSFIEEIFSLSSAKKSEKDSSYALKESSFFDFSINSFTNPFHDLNYKNTFLPLSGLGLVGAFLLRNTSYGRLLGAISLLLMGGCTAGKPVDSADDTGDTGGLGVSGTSLASADVELTTGEALDALGYSAIGAGDINGDGNKDIAVSAPFSDDRLGSVYIQKGPISSGEKTFSSDDIKLVGDSDEDTVFGSNLSAAGDVDGDGYDDLAVATDYKNGTGAVYIAEGPFENGVTALGGTDTKITGENELDYAGEIALANPGDVNGDGQVDTLIGAYGNENGTGVAYVVYGPPSSQNLASADVKLLGTDVFDFMGYSVDGAGDVNGDGLPDLISGGPFAGEKATGGAYVVEGPIPEGVSLFSDVGVLLNGENDGEAGTGVWGVGDLEGDGYDDVMVGDANLGRAYIATGPVSGMSLADASVTLTGESKQGDAFGYDVSNLGDVDGDGHDDLLVGAPDLGQNVGGAYILYGPVSSGSYVVTGLKKYNKWVGAEDFDIAGYSVANVGDVNSDGYPDALVGAPNYSISLDFFSGEDYDETVKVGSAYLIFGGG